MFKTVESCCGIGGCLVTLLPVWGDPECGRRAGRRSPLPARRLKICSIPLVWRNCGWPGIMSTGRQVCRMDDHIRNRALTPIAAPSWQRLLTDWAFTYSDLRNIRRSTWQTLRWIGLKQREILRDGERWSRGKRPKNWPTRVSLS